MNMDLNEIIDQVTGANEHNMRRDRPYDGQAHTDAGKRGQTQISGITFRDLSDAFLRAAFLSAYRDAPAGYAEACKGENAVLTWNDLYDLDLSNIDPRAWSQNLSCEVERLMGIFPNVPELRKVGS